MCDCLVVTVRTREVAKRFSVFLQIDLLNSSSKYSADHQLCNRVQDKALMVEYAALEVRVYRLLSMRSQAMLVAPLNSVEVQL